MRHLNSARSRFMTQPSNNYNSRVLLKRLKETLSKLGEAQARLDEIVKIIAVSMKSEVCSIYLLNRNNNLELYATEGLQSKAVHYSELNVGQGLVGKIAATAEPIKTSQVSKTCLLYTSPSPRDRTRSRMPSSA